MPLIDIPRFEINKVEIHTIPIWKFNNPIVNYTNKPVVDIPGCVRVHRNNLTSLIDDPKDEYGIKWNDSDLSIKWGNKSPLLSEKDDNLPNLKDQKYLPRY